MNLLVMNKLKLLIYQKTLNHIAMKFKIKANLYPKIMKKKRSKNLTSNKRLFLINSQQIQKQNCQTFNHFKHLQTKKLLTIRIKRSRKKLNMKKLFLKMKEKIMNLRVDLMIGKLWMILRKQKSYKIPSQMTGRKLKETIKKKVSTKTILA